MRNVFGATPSNVPQGRPLVAYIRANCVAADGEWEHVFPSQTAKNKPISEKTILYALYRMGYKDKATGHGFRVLAITNIKEQLGYRHEVVDRQLAHAHRNSIDAVYDKVQFWDERKIMMQDWADFIDNLRNGYYRQIAA